MLRRAFLPNAPARGELPGAFCCCAPQGGLLRSPGLRLDLFGRMRELPAHHPPPHPTPHPHTHTAHPPTPPQPPPYIHINATCPATCPPDRGLLYLRRRAGPADGATPGDAAAQRAGAAGGAAFRLHCLLPLPRAGGAAGGGPQGWGGLEDGVRWGQESAWGGGLAEGCQDAVCSACSTYALHGHVG